VKTGISTFIYVNYPLPEALRRIADIGYDAVDIWGGRPHAYRRDLSHSDIERLKRLLQQLHLSVASFIPAQFRYPTCLCSNNETIRRDSVAYIADSIQTAAALGAPVVSVCPGHSLHGQGKRDAWMRLSESLVTISDFATAYGTRIAIEPADRYETDLVGTTSDAMRLIRQLSLANLGIVFDVGHAHVMSEPIAEALQMMGDRLFHVHVDDNNGQRDQHLIPGDGSIDFPALIALLRQAGYDGCLSAELSWDYTLQPDAAAETALSRMKQYSQM
jgi:protein FrlC